MPRYFYRATSPTGESESGVLEAKDEYELARLLRRKGHILVSATEEKPKKKIKILLNLGKVPIKEKLFFTRNFKLMIKTGVPLPKALEILSSQSRNKRFKKILLEVREEIIKGRKLSEILRDWPGVFSELFCSMIRVGEETGKLEEVLESLTKQIERTYELKSRVQGALVYPAIIIVAMVGIGILMLIVVVPPLAETFEELGVELPLTTQLVISAADFMIKFWFIFPIIALILFFLARQFLKTKKGDKLVDGLLLKIPIISPIIKETNTAYTARTLSTLISSGVPIIKSLEVVSRTLNNFYFREAMIVSAEGVRKGSKLSEALEPFSKIYPLSFSEMIAVGEETGETSSILEKLADFSEAEVERLTKNLASAIEPVIMIIIGTGVGFFAVSMIQPMYSMLGGL